MSGIDGHLIAKIAGYGYVALAFLVMGVAAFAPTSDGNNTVIPTDPNFVPKGFIGDRIKSLKTKFNKFVAKYKCEKSR